MSAPTQEVRELAAQVDRAAANMRASVEAELFVQVATALRLLAAECEALQRLNDSRTAHLV